MSENHKRFLYISLAGVFLLAICAIGACISSISVYNSISEIQGELLLVPYIISYLLIAIGLAGLFDIVDKIRRGKN